jgi:hypothetical protein
MVGAQVLRQLSLFNCLGKGAGEYAVFDGERLFSMAPAPSPVSRSPQVVEASVSEGIGHQEVLRHRDEMLNACDETRAMLLLRFHSG